jgi:hypothetical protein
MGLVTSLVTFLVGLLVGGFGIYVGGAIIAGKADYEHAVWTALVGAIVWTVMGTFFGWIPLLGSVLTFGAYLLVIRLRYPGGWITAAGIALVAWVTLVAVYAVVGPLGLGLFDPVGVPFV